MTEKPRGKELVLGKVTVDTAGCWIWHGKVDRQGYGRGGAKNGLAHRYSYRAFRGAIPDGLELDHLCCVPLCVNPAHLEPVTRAENMRRRAAKQTRCKAGHEFTPENTYTYTRKQGWLCRGCRACNLASARRYAARKRTTP